MARGIGPKGEAKAATTMREFHRGDLHSGSKEGPKVRSLEQAKAIAMSQAREASEAAPREPSGNNPGEREAMRLPFDRRGVGNPSQPLSQSAGGSSNPGGHGRAEAARTARATDNPGERPHPATGERRETGRSRGDGEREGGRHGRPEAARTARATDNPGDRGHAVHGLELRAPGMRRGE